MANGTMAGWRLTSPIPKDPVYDKRGFGLQSSRADRKQRSRSSPIPVDPVYANGMEDSHNAAPRPRVKPEAINIARLHQGGALAQLFNPAFRVIPIGSRPSKFEFFGECTCLDCSVSMRLYKERLSVKMHKTLVCLLHHHTIALKMIISIRSTMIIISAVNSNCKHIIIISQSSNIQSSSSLS